MGMWQSKGHFLISTRWLLPWVICRMHFYGFLPCLSRKAVENTLQEHTPPPPPLIRDMLG